MYFARSQPREFSSALFVVARGETRVRVRATATVTWRLFRGTPTPATVPRITVHHGRSIFLIYDCTPFSHIHIFTFFAHTLALHRVSYIQDATATREAVIYEVLSTS